MSLEGREGEKEGGRQQDSPAKGGLARSQHGRKQRNWGSLNEAMCSYIQLYTYRYTYMYVCICS